MILRTQKPPRHSLKRNYGHTVVNCLLFPTHIIVNLFPPPPPVRMEMDSERHARCPPPGEHQGLRSMAQSKLIASQTLVPKPSGQLPFGFLLPNVRGLTLARNRNYTIIPRKFVTILLNLGLKHASTFH